MSVKIDEAFVKSVTPPAKGSKPYWDSEVKGFAIRVYAPTARHPEGQRSFLISYYVNGVEKRHTIGNFPLWSAAAGRAEAKKLRKRIDQGEDPALAKREAREAPTVADLAERYRRDYLPSKSPASRKADAAMIEKEILPVLGKRKVAEVHEGDAEALHKAISKSKSTSARWRNSEKGRVVRANRVAALGSKMFALAYKKLPGEDSAWRDASLPNPFKGLERNQEEGRERFFSTAEIAALGDALAEHTGPAADCLRLILLTGARPGEAMRAHWDEFADQGFWDKPSAHTKQKKRHRVPLSPPATELVSRLRSEREEGAEFVFPGRIKGKPIREMRRVWEKVTKRAGLEGEIIYTLRHSFASIGVGGGLSLQIIGKLLGHSTSATTTRYAHLADDALREATNRIGSTIAGAGKNGDNVVTLARSK
jgi:integrase